MALALALAMALAMAMALALAMAMALAKIFQNDAIVQASSAVEAGLRENGKPWWWHLLQTTMKTFYLVVSSTGNHIKYGDESIPLTRENLDRVIAEVRQRPLCPEIKIPACIDDLYVK